MTATVAKISRFRQDESHVLEAAYLHLTSTKHTTASLARALGVSVPTAFRLITRLRRRLRILSVKRGREWYYEVPIPPLRRSLWNSDPLVRRLGFIKKSGRRTGESVDQAVYERE
ncbi:MAG: hypothetical protein HY716_10410 [Planctomycetes bacterium]|nr:hypothetical protein [Planctomycetota bacterium]